MLDSIKSALLSILGNKARSLLTVLGVVIGVTSVTILVALGQGLQKDVSNLVEGLGTNVMAAIGGKLDTEGGAGGNPANFVSGDILTEEDVASIAEIDHISSVTPVSLVTGNLKYGELVANPTIMAANSSILQSLQLFVMDEGAMFADADMGVVVISAKAKETLFANDSAIGKTILLGKEEVRVVGVLSDPTIQNSISGEYNNVALIPFAEAKRMNEGKAQISRILMSVDDAENVNSAKAAVHAVMLANHDGEEDFSILTQDDLLDLFSTFLNLATAMVSAIAAISLIVGGIGIMNIMLVTVTERTKEIGLRKAVGATQGAILLQFLVEAIVVTLLGGLIGLGIAFAVGAVVAANTELTPVFSATTVGTALGVSIVIGIIFGIWPALRAARKDPIEALRYE